MKLHLNRESTLKGTRVMAKQRPYRPKGHSSGHPPSGQRPAIRPAAGRIGAAPAPAAGRRTRTAPTVRRAGRRRHGPHRSGPKPGTGPDRRDRTGSGAPEPRSRTNFEPGKPERLQKVLAQAGLGSRRGCEELILQGRVTVDGQVVRELGTKVDPAGPDRRRRRADPAGADGLLRRQQAQGLRLDQLRPLRAAPGSSTSLPEIPERVYTVGRLDEDSTGLMILTNDGELANRLAHPALRRREAVPGPGRRHADPRDADQADRRRLALRRQGPAPSGRGSPAARARPRCSSWSWPRARNARSAGCCPSSATRSCR